MGSRKAVALSTVSTALSLIFLLPQASSSGQSIEGLEWGSPVDGLRMSITAADSLKGDVPEFQVTFRNGGKKNVILNLGHMLANGKVLLPDRISLKLTDGGRRTRKLSFFDKKLPGIAGRLDDYIIPLRAGSTYALDVSLDQFCSPDTNEYPLMLTPGKYQITAQFEESGARAVNRDTQGIRLLNFSLGKLPSNILAIER